MLTIGKPAQFNERGRALKGQCQPYSHDWQLKFFTKGTSKTLFAGTYYICRQFQAECRGLNDVSEIKEKILQISSDFLDDTQETAVLNDGQIINLSDPPSEAKTSTILIDKNQLDKKPEDIQNTDQ